MAIDASYILSKIWAWNNTANAPLPPSTQTVTGSGRTSIATGFPPECSKRVAEGGVPPYGQDVNGILRMVTANLVWMSAGGMFDYDSTRAYTPPAIVNYSGKFYMNISACTGIAPTNTTYWRTVLDYRDYQGIVDMVDEQECGTYKWFAYSSSIPSNYLVCNGQTVSRTTYSRLFGKIGTTYGVGDGSTTFGLPNLVGRVLWGATSAIGTQISPALPNITGRGGMGEARASGGNYDLFMNQASGAFYWDKSQNYYGSGGGIDSDDALMCFDASRSNSIYKNNVNTVQPPALTALPCIHI